MRMIFVLFASDLFFLSFLSCVVLALPVMCDTGPFTYCTWA